MPLTIARRLPACLLTLALVVATARLDAALEGFLKVNSLDAWNRQSPDPLLTTWSPMRSFRIRADNSIGVPGTLYVAKAADNLTPELMYVLARGAAATSANFFVRNVGQATPIFALNMKNGYINYIRQSCDPLNGPTDEVGIIFQSLEVSVSTVDPQSSAVTSTTSAWNFSTATEVAQTAPSLSLGATTVTTLEDTPTSVTLTVGDDFSNVASLTVTATSSNPAVVANTGLVFSGTTASRTLQITPVANASGTATVTVSVRDNSGLVTTADIAVTVTAVNDPPVVASVGAQVAWAGFPVMAGWLSLPTTWQKTPPLPPPGDSAATVRSPKPFPCSMNRATWSLAMSSATARLK